MNRLLLFLGCGFLLAPRFVGAQPTPPVIAHDPPPSVVAGQPFRVVARVGAPEPVRSVTLRVARSGGAAPVALPMRAAGAGVYVGRVDPELFSTLEDFRYYIDAKGASGAFTETNWVTVRVIGGAAKQPRKEDGWRRPVLIGAGAAVAVGAGVALAGSGGGGDDDGGDAGGGGIDPADQVIVRTASQRVDESNPTLPQLVAVDAEDELAGRTVKRIRIRMEFNGEDGGAEEYEVIYNGSAVLSGSTGGTQTRQIDLVGNATTRVEFLILSSTPVDGASAYSYLGTVTYFVE